MEYEMKRLLEEYQKEKHKFAMQTLAKIASIKEECKANKRCEDCRFFNEKERIYSKCVLFGKFKDFPKD